MVNAKQHVKAKVLVVDDEEELTELIKLALKEEYRVEAVFNGQEALQMLKTFKPDLIVTDIYMPVLDGFDLIEEVRKVSINTPIIIVSGAKLRRKMSYFHNKGIAAVMVKPFSLKDLKAEILAALRGYAKFI